MNDQLTAIHTELLMMKEELQSRLFEYSCFQMSASVEPSMNDQEATLIYHIKKNFRTFFLPCLSLKTIRTVIVKNRRPHSD